MNVARLHALLDDFSDPNDTSFVDLDVLLRAFGYVPDDDPDLRELVHYEHPVWDTVTLNRNQQRFGAQFVGRIRDNLRAILPKRGTLK